MLIYYLFYYFVTESQKEKRIFFPLVYIYELYIGLFLKNQFFFFNPYLPGRRSEKAPGVARRILEVGAYSAQGMCKVAESDPGYYQAR